MSRQRVAGGDQKLHGKMCGKYLVFIFLFYTFLFGDQITTAVPFWKYADEFIALTALPLWVLNLLKRRKTALKYAGVYIYIFGFLCCCLAGTCIYSYQPFFEAALPDLLLCAKFWLCLYFGMRVFRNFDIAEYAGKLYLQIKIITWSFFILSVLNMTAGIFHYYDYRFGIGSNSLFYAHPTVLVGCCSLLAVMLIAIRPVVRGSLFYMVLLMITLCTSLRSKAVADVIIFAAICFLSSGKRNRLSVKHMLLLIPPVVLAGWWQIEFYFIELEGDSARSMLLLKSFQIANDHFPFGAGSGTYGSFFSSVYYSPLYYEYGLNTVYGLSEDFYDFMFDSFWPMILGQAGYPGLLLYAAAILQLFKEIGLLKSSRPHFYSSALGVMGFLLIESCAASAFVHPSALPFAIWLGMLLGSADFKPVEKYSRRYSSDGERPDTPGYNGALPSNHVIGPTNVKERDCMLHALGEE